MKFSAKLGVFVCPHVFHKTRPLLLVVHEEGEWQCLCGHQDHGNEGHLVGMGHLVDRDPSIDELYDLKDGWEAEKVLPEGTWIRTKCKFDC